MQVLCAHSPSQSEPTILVYQVDQISFQSLELKKNQVQNIDLKKAGRKKQGHCYSKREEAAWPLLFLNNNDPVFLQSAFCNPYFGLFLTVPDPKKISGQPDKLEQWMQIDWAIGFLRSEFFAEVLEVTALATYNGTFK